MTLYTRLVFLSGIFSLPLSGLSQSAQSLMNEPVDLSRDFKDYLNTYFLADSLAGFDPQTGQGAVKWRRARYTPAHAFNYTQHALQRAPQNEFPATEYAADPVLPFVIQFVRPRRFGSKCTPERCCLPPNFPSCWFGNPKTGYATGSTPAFKRPPVHQRFRDSDRAGKSLGR